MGYCPASELTGKTDVDKKRMHPVTLQSWQTVHFLCEATKFLKQYGIHHVLIQQIAAMAN